MLTIERRVKCVAFDAPPSCRVEELTMPVTDKFPEGTQILSLHPYPLQNCVVALVTHPTFPEVAPFAHLDSEIMFYKEANDANVPVRDRSGTVD